MPRGFLAHGQLKMAFPERRTADILLTILFFAMVCVAVYGARRIILIFVFAVFFAYLINPLVKFLQRHSLFFRNLRGPAVVEVYLAFVILMALLGYEFAPGLARNTVKLVDQVPVLLDGLSTGNIATELRGEYGWSEEQEFRFRAFLTRHKGDIQGLVTTTDRYLSNAARVLGLLFVIPILAIFFLRDGDHIADIFIQLFFPTNLRPRIRAVARELHIMLTQYMRAQVLLCGLSFLFYSGAMLLLRFPHAIALGFLGGLLEFIPAVGWISTFAAVIGIGILNHSHWILMAALLGVWRVIQDYYTTPRIMGHHLKIHPLAAIFGVLVGAEIGGIVGIYLAVPMMASMRVIWRAYAAEQSGPGRHAHFDVDGKVPELLETGTI
ncbi:MAG TPA: AI-2E family transporter [Terriglobales bacterium]|nr:AI-2E family transporter [Terriglobales bacterium]